MLAPHVHLCACRDGWIARHEVFFYTLDTLLVLLWLLVMVPLHFGVFLRRLRGDMEPLVQASPAKPPPGTASHLVADSGLHTPARDTEMV